MQSFVLFPIRLECKKEEITVFSEVELFLSTLENITLLEIQVLRIVSQSVEIDSREISIEGVNSF